MLVLLLMACQAAPPTATPTAPPPTETSAPTETPTLAPAPTTFTLPPPTPTPTLTATLPPPSATPTPSATVTPKAPAKAPPDGVYRAATLPILMYHYISVPPADADEIRRDLSVAPEAFEAQLRYFKEQGYQSIRLADLVNHLTSGAPLPPRPILFTFDDGYQDALTNAFPLLQKYGFTGAFFVITAFADESRPGYLTWADVQTMHAGGMEFGTHSYNHPDLIGKNLDFLVFQTLGPKQALEQRTGEPTIAYCYPLGRYDEQAIAVLRSAHYQVALTTMQGMLHTSTGLFELKRVRVRGSDRVEDLVKRIEYLAALKE